MKPPIQIMMLSLLLSATTVHAGPPDDPPCQDSGRGPQKTLFGRDTTTLGTIPIDGGVKCSVVRSCENSDVHLLSVLPDPSGPNEYHYEAMIHMNPTTNGSRDGDHDTELLRLIADMTINGTVSITDVTVMTVIRQKRDGEYLLRFNAIDPNAIPISGDDSHLIRVGVVNVGDSSIFKFLDLHMSHDLRHFSARTWDENDGEFRVSVPYVHQLAVSYTNLSVQVNSPANACNSDPKPFDFELNRERLNGVTVIQPGS